MKLLHEAVVGTDVLAEEALTLCGSRPTDVFEGDTLNADVARDIAESLDVPGSGVARVVTCSFSEVLPRSYDILLRPVEESKASVFFACNPPAPETFRSRFRCVTSRVPALSTLYAEFGELSQEKTLADVCVRYPEVGEGRLHRLYDEYLQSVGPVSEFITAMHDGNHEAALRASLSFGEVELELLHTELELQLQDKSLTKTVLTRTTKDRLLAASAFREVRFGITPASHAALLLYTVLD